MQKNKEKLISIDALDQTILGPNLRTTLENSLDKINETHNGSVVEGLAMELFGLLGSSKDKIIDLTYISGIYEDSDIDISIYKKEDRLWDGLEDFELYLSLSNSHYITSKLSNSFISEPANNQKINAICNGEDVIRERFNLQMSFNSHNKYEDFLELTLHLDDLEFSEGLLSTSNVEYFQEINIYNSMLNVDQEFDGIRNDIEGILRIEKMGYVNKEGEERYSDHLLLVFSKNYNKVEFLYHKDANFDSIIKGLKDSFNEGLLKNFFLSKRFKN